MAAYVTADENAQQEFTIPVEWSVFDTVKVQASSLEEAFKYVQENLSEIPLGPDPDYVEGSYAIAANSAEDCLMYNPQVRTVA